MFIEYYNVPNLIKRLNFLATDKHELTEKEKTIYLECLNLANNELYEIASNGLKSLIKIKDLFLDQSTQSFILPDNCFKISQISGSSLEFRFKSAGNVSSTDGIDYYSIVGNNITININNSKITQKLDPADGAIKKYIQIAYIENPKILVEIVNDINLETNYPIYPAPYIQYLLYGGLYFFYFSNKIFMEKMSHILVQWENSKKNLGQYSNYGI
jgi:hypothetical protein